MNRSEFISKFAGLIILGGLSMSSLAGDPENVQKKYTVVAKRCDGCGHCFKACRHNALEIDAKGKATINQKKCEGCGDCLRFCRRMAIVEAQ